MAKTETPKKGTKNLIDNANKGGVTQKTLREDRLKKAGTGNGMYLTGPAPRVGGKQKMIGQSGNVMGGTKSMIKQSKKRVSKSGASAQAKKAAKRLY